MRDVALALALTLLAGPALAQPTDRGVIEITNTLPGLAYRVLKSGPAEGRSPARADTITVRYRGWLENGKVFNTSADDGKGVTSFELGKLIPGWIAALQMMKPGDVWRLTIPSYLGYGRLGKPAHNIPPDATLTFDVELVAVTPAPPPPEPAK